MGSRYAAWGAAARQGAIAATLLSLGMPPQVTGVTVREGTSMAVAASPDGRFLAIDLQGSIWILPAAGGEARRITDEYNDARQPSWSPDGRTIVFQGYRDGGYDIWAVAPDGSGLRKMTSGPFDDREPIWSHDGRRIAFSSDRSDAESTGAIAGDYNIWVLDVASESVRQITRGPADEYMPTWSPDDRELAFVAARGNAQSINAVALQTGVERTLVQGGGARGRLDAPSWGPGGTLVHYALGQGASRLEVDSSAITANENAFPFRASWVSPTEFFYTSDGKVRRRSIGGAAPRTIEFSATLRVTKAAYARRPRDVDSRAPRKALGIVRPVISPDGRQVAFAALGDVYVMDIGDSPRKLTNDAAFDTDPAWSPDGTRLAWSSDRAGGLPAIWVQDVRGGEARRLTSLSTAALAPTWSPDGSRIAFLDVDGIWGRANVSVVDVAGGGVTQVRASLFAPGNPTWSPDGKHIALAALQPYSARFREGTNQILSFPATAAPADGGPAGRDVWVTPVRHRSIDSRVGGGPVWSPDGTRMALIYEGLLYILPVNPDGTPSGMPRRLTGEMAHAPSWTGDSRRILYQSMDRLRLIDVESGAARDVPLDLSYTPAIPATRVVVHAGGLFTGASRDLERDRDVVIAGNRIQSVGPHNEATHRMGEVVDASGLTVMPGLIEYHSHLQKDLGSSSGRAALAFGITTLRSPGGSPYESVEYREAVDAGVRPGPRIFSTGYLLEWRRVYYNMSVPIADSAHLERELERARVLQHDLIKSYVRMPDLQQKRIIEFAHAAGVPVSSHEVYPSALSGIDATDHVGATSRRGYSPKQGPLQQTYADVREMFSASGITLTPTLALSGAGLRRLIAQRPELAQDARFGLYPQWLRATMASRAAPPAGLSPADAGNSARTVMALMRAGTPILAGTDTPNAANLHAELATYVAAGMRPFEALQTATVNPARALGLDAGVIAPGKLADFTIVAGNPLDDITATLNVRTVIANGRIFRLEDLTR